MKVEWEGECVRERVTVRVRATHCVVGSHWGNGVWLDRTLLGSQEVRVFAEERSRPP